MTKEYRSRWNFLKLNVIVGGKNVNVEFNPLRDGGSYLVVRDDELSKALEKQRGFNKDFVLHGSTVNEKVEVEQPELIKPPKEIQEAVDKGELVRVRVIEDVKNVNQARNYLKSIGVDHRRLNSLKNVLKQAEENNVEFPNLKTE